MALQIGLERDSSPYLADVPLIMDLTNDPARQAALKLIVSRQSIARPFAAPPGVPAERVRMLREAFDATMQDPDFLAEARTGRSRRSAGDRRRGRGADQGDLRLAARGGEARHRGDEERAVDRLPSAIFNLSCSAKAEHPVIAVLWCGTAAHCRLSGAYWIVRLRGR